MKSHEPASNKKGGVVLRVNISEHLIDLQAQENNKPLDQQRTVPTLAELARRLKPAGVNRTSLYNTAGNKQQSVNLTLLSKVMSELQALGFPTEIQDLLKAHPADSVAARRE